MAHRVHCQRCKPKIKQLLQICFGEVIEGYSLDLGSKPEDYIDTPIHADLYKIYERIVKSRGYDNFIGVKKIPKGDFLVPNPGFIVEFDEPQHFTLQRKLALESYPDSVKLGFEMEKWIGLCDTIHATDNDPYNRDEKRAWYDTLRDFAPELLGLLPTIRLYENELPWCELDPEKLEDIQKFKALLGMRGKTMQNWIATVTLRTETDKNFEKNPARMKSLGEICRSLRKKYSGEGIVLFPGGWLHTGTKPALEEFEKNVSEVSASVPDGIVACFGIDGNMIDDPESKGYRFDRDQVALAVDKSGLIAFGRKFCPTNEIERELLTDIVNDGKFEKKFNTKTFLNGREYSRIFTNKNGISSYLAVCYDINGLEALHKSNPNGTFPKFDIILNLVHFCYPSKTRDPGKDIPRCTYFSRARMGGASKEWHRPVFGAVVFVRGEIYDCWRTGMFWRNGAKPILECQTDENSIKPSYREKYPLFDDVSIDLAEDSTNIYADICVFNLDGVLSNPEINRFSLNEFCTQRAAISKEKDNGKIRSDVELAMECEILSAREALINHFRGIFSDKIIQQVSKITFRAINRIGYPNKSELDAISVFRTSNPVRKGLKVRIYPYVVAGFFNIDVNGVLQILPKEFRKASDRGQDHEGSQYIDFILRDRQEIERFIHAFDFLINPK